MFHFCYLDESGCTGFLPAANLRIQPVFVIAGLIISADSDRLTRITRDFMHLKRRFNPGLFSEDEHNLDAILREIKGASFRENLKSNSRDRRRAALGFMDGAMGLLEENHVRLIGRLWVKGVNREFKGREIYTSSAQSIARGFQRFLQERQSRGIIVCDSRNPQLNAQVSHSVFTQKLQAAGDVFPNLLDAPVFADSRNHAGIQLTDVLCSAILSPLATAVYHPGSPHAHPNYLLLRERFGERLKKIQFRFKDENGKRRGGIVVSDPGRQPGGLLFQPPPSE